MADALTAMPPPTLTTLDSLIGTSAMTRGPSRVSKVFAITRPLQAARPHLSSTRTRRLPSRAAFTSSVASRRKAALLTSDLRARDDGGLHGPADRPWQRRTS